VPAKLDRLEPRPVEEPPAPVGPPPPMDFAQAPSDWPEVEREAAFGSGPFKVSSHGPIALYAIEPVYPMTALRKGTTGRVRIQFTINPDGSVSDVVVVEAEPRRGIFDS